MEDFRDAVVISEGGVNFRVAKSTGSTRIATIKQGEKILAKDLGDGWSQAVHGGKKGYVMTKFISFDPDAQDAADNANALALVDNITKELAQLRKLLQA